MSSFGTKSKKIFITFLILIILISCFSRIYAISNTHNLKVGYKLRFTGSRCIVYNSRTAALTKNPSGMVDYLENYDEITVKGILR